ncbi:MAG: hypothetical protein WCT50_04235 [Patescibacteria group bacterium]
MLFVIIVNGNWRLRSTEPMSNLRNLSKKVILKMRPVSIEGANQYNIFFKLDGKFLPQVCFPEKGNLRIVVFEEESNDTRVNFAIAQQIADSLMGRGVKATDLTVVGLSKTSK